MNLLLTEEQEMIRSTAQEFAQKILLPLAEEMDLSGKIPSQVMEHIAKLDFNGIILSEEYGGSGFPPLAFSLIVQEIAKVSASVASSYVGNICGAFIIEKFGTEEQKRKYLPSIISGERMVAVATSEPNGGSNWAMTLQTSAEIDGESFVINGRKSFISNAEDADLYIVSSRTSSGKGPMEFSGILVEKGTQGFSFGKKEEKLGLRGLSNGELLFDQCKVPKENLIGAMGDLLSEIMPVYGGLYCVGHSATAAGISRAAFESAQKYVQERSLTNTMGLAHFDGVQAKIADLAIELEMVELLTYRTALSRGIKGPDAMVQMASTKSNELAIKITNEALLLHGGSGCITDYPMERYLRDARTLTFYPAVYNYYRLFAGKVLLGIPLGPPPKG